jgi:uncharacterized membrane protein YvlD (DUF360 family)
MKTILKTIFVNILILYVVSQLFKGIEFKNGLSTFLTAGIALAVSSILVKPLINIMILPINLITFGVFRWLSSVAVLYIVTLLVPDFIIQGFYYGGFNSIWFDIPVINVHGFFAIILFSIVISTFGTFFHWLLK